MVLRDVEDGDVTVFFEHQRDPLAVGMAGLPARELAEHLANWRRILADPTVRTRTVVADGGIAGNVLSFVADGRRMAGYWLGREWWGRGIATAALESYLRIELSRPLYARVEKRNGASLRVLEKCGFVPDGEAGDALSLVLR